MNPTGGKKDNRDTKYERRDDRDVFTDFRWDGTIVGPTRIVAAQDQIAKRLREQRKTALRGWPGQTSINGATPLRVVVCGDEGTFARTFDALHKLDLAARAATSPRRRARRTLEPPVITSAKTSVMCARREGELLEIAASGYVDVILVDPDRFAQEDELAGEWLREDIRLAAEDGYPPALVVIEDDDPDPYSYPPELYGMFVGLIRESAPIDDWVDNIRRAPARRITRLLAEEGGRRARDSGLVDGPFAQALSALFFDVAQLVPFTPARDAGATLAAVALDETAWSPDHPLPEPAALSRRELSSARKHLARRLTRLGLPSADTLVTLVRVAYAVTIARYWRLSADDAARYAGFKTERQLRMACTRVGGAPFTWLCHRLDFGARPIHFAVMLFRDYWDDGHARFEWTFLERRITLWRRIALGEAFGTQLFAEVSLDGEVRPSD